MATYSIPFYCWGPYEDNPTITVTATPNKPTHAPAQSTDITLEGEGLTYTLMVDGQEKGTINIPQDQFLDNVSYDNDNKELIFTFAMEDKKSDVKVSIADLIKEYQSGSGIKVDGDTISVKVDGETQPYITVTTDGVKVEGIDEKFAQVYTKAEIDAKGFLTEHQDIANLASKDEIPSIEGLASEDWTMNVNNLMVATLVSRIAALEDKVAEAAKTNVVVCEGGTTFNDTEADFKVTSDASETLTITGKTITIDDVNVSNDARLKLNGDTTMKSVDFNGSFTKTKGNSIVSVNECADVVLRDCTINPVTCYNGVEIGLNGSELPKSVLIDNCDFSGTFSNNAVLVFGTQDNAVININNCHFGNVSNVLRLSNKTNVKCTVNFTNCSFDSLDSNLQYTGVVLCQDYTSAAADIVDNNLFGDGKVTINFINCKLRGEKIQPANAEEICGSKNEKQLIYVYADRGNPRLVAYSAERYPIVSIV